MNKTNLIIVIILIILAFLAGLWIKGMNTPIETMGNGLSLSVESIHQIDNFYNIQVEYPQFANLDSFNKEISDTITNKIDTFKKDAKDNYEARRETAPTSSPLPESPAQPFDFIASWKPAQINDSYISFVVNLYYFSGGAHGLNETYAFNYDLDKKQDISILDFLNSTSSLDNLAELSKERVISQLQSNGIQMNDSLNEMVDSGTAPTEENYKNFTFNYNSLTIYFQQYQVAPGAAGSMDITIYKNALSSDSIESDYLR